MGKSRATMAIPVPKPGKDQSDVDNAASTVQYYIDNKMAVDLSIVIVNYGNCSFSSWPHTVVYDALTTEPDQLSRYVDESICDPTYATQPPVYPTLPPASSANAGCECNHGTIWLDVFLLMEATTSMQSGIDGAINYIETAFMKLTIGQAEQYQTRFGVIRYASDVELIADLDTYKSTTDLLDLEIKIYDDLGTNIEGALKMATDRFNSSVHRIAARPVVIIVGNSYRSGAYNDPSQAAAGFRENGGAIITLEYVQEHGLEVPELRSLASPNYNLTNEKNDGTYLLVNDLRDLLCKANCFCRKNWQEYNLDKWNAPQGGCYYPVSIPDIQPSAQQACTHNHNSTLTLVEDSAKNSFLTSIFPSKTEFWLGLTNDGDGWKWQGGYSTGYTNWGPDQPGSGRCAYMQQYSGFRYVRTKKKKKLKKYDIKYYIS
ncbi:unnamed protein product [Cylicocyclus nassatus]|uniref:VWFA domain-containing protein n=1 Tax=Cylicocyclus nassatus TaxID=53992 RepID=A0AA36M4W5_CYLNA|nr:unnamed protein product [Cylicocyclus nassatus]